MNGQEDKEKEILVTRSSLPSYEEYIEMIKPIWDSAWLTNMGDFHKQLEKELKELEEATKAAAPAEETAPEYITIDDFSKVRFVTAKVLACEAVKKSKKLLRFTLDCGEAAPRQILSGIHEYYEPEELVGKTVVACTNLAPRKMMGLESNGMLISAVKEEPDGSEKLHLLMLDDQVPAGYGLC